MRLLFLRRSGEPRSGLLARSKVWLTEVRGISREEGFLALEEKHFGLLSVLAVAALVVTLASASVVLVIFGDVGALLSLIWLPFVVGLFILRRRPLESYSRTAFAVYLAEQLRVEVPRQPRWQEIVPAAVACDCATAWNDLRGILRARVASISTWLNARLNLHLVPAGNHLAQVLSYIFVVIAAIPPLGLLVLFHNGVAFLSYLALLGYITHVCLEVLSVRRTIRMTFANSIASKSQDLHAHVDDLQDEIARRTDALKVREAELALESQRVINEANEIMNMVERSDPSLRWISRFRTGKTEAAEAAQRRYSVRMLRWGVALGALAGVAATELYSALFK